MSTASGSAAPSPSPLGCLTITRLRGQSVIITPPGAPPILVEVVKTRAPRRQAGGELLASG